MVDMDTVNLRGVTGASSTWKRGPNVRRVQGLLVASGHAPRNTIRPNGTLDGVGGPGTRDATLRFQRARGLTDDAIVGPKTWRRLLGA